VAMLGWVHPDAERRFGLTATLHKARGRVRGYQLGGIE